jgi:hypothetical protein
VYSRFNPHEFRERLRRSDIIAVDLDECVYPGFAQSDLGYLMFFAIATKPIVTSDRRYLPQMISGGAYIRKVAMLRQLGRGPSNQELMQRYEQSMRAIPEAYFLSEARNIPARSYPDALETLALLGQRAPLGLISLGIDVIAAQYARQLNGDGDPRVRFTDSNRIVFGAGRDGRAAFERYQPPLLVGPEDKLRILTKRMDELHASYPLVIGNGKDEAAMAALAHERGGISIGINPSKTEAAYFDACVMERNWGPLRELVQQLAPSGTSFS